MSSKLTSAVALAILLVAGCRNNQPTTAAQINMKLLFDDPSYVDAEPVAVYERKFTLRDAASEKSSYAASSADLPLVNSQEMAASRHETSSRPRRNSVG